MSLPTSYRHNAMSAPVQTPAPPPHYGQYAGMPNNILKERLRATGGVNSKESNVSPFTSSTSNPNFNPQRAGSKPMTQTTAPKPPKGPEKPLMPYMRYSKSVWETVKQQNQDLKLWEIGKIIGSMWRDLPENDKQEFVDEYETEKADYERAVKDYHASASYQAYLSAKSKAAEEAAPHAHEVKQPVNTVMKGLDRRIDIQPAEDDEDQDEQFSVKQVAHARYLRNHRLINEIFSDTVVPDMRTVVNTSRMQLLKRQVHSLTMHQKKLEGELQQIEEKFEAKKQKFEESTTTFNDELKTLCEKKVDDSLFADMVKKQIEVLRKEREEQQKPIEPIQSPAPMTGSNVATPADLSADECSAPQPSPMETDAAALAERAPSTAAAEPVPPPSQASSPPPPPAQAPAPPQPPPSQQAQQQALPLQQQQPLPPQQKPPAPQQMPAYGHPQMAPQAHQMPPHMPPPPQMHPGQVPPQSHQMPPQQHAMPPQPHQMAPQMPPQQMHPGQMPPQQQIHSGQMGHQMAPQQMHPGQMSHQMPPQHMHPGQMPSHAAQGAPPVQQPQPQQTPPPQQ